MALTNTQTGRRFGTSGGVTPKSSNTSGTSTATFTGSMIAIGAITSAYSAYETGRMQQLAYDHKAAMTEINAEQMRIDAQFQIADRKEELAKNLALQNVMAAAQGRTGGSVVNLAEESIANLEKEERRAKVTGKLKRISSLMDAEMSRRTGESSARMGMLSGVSQSATGAGQASGYLS